MSLSHIENSFFKSFAKSVLFVYFNELLRVIRELISECERL